jgi:hypothetical protein
VHIKHPRLTYSALILPPSGARGRSHAGAGASAARRNASEAQARQDRKATLPGAETGRGVLALGAFACPGMQDAVGIQAGPRPTGFPGVLGLW